VRFVLLIFLALAGVWASHLAADYSGLKDPQFVVIDESRRPTPDAGSAADSNRHAEFAGTHMDFSVYAIFSALSLVKLENICWRDFAVPLV